MSDSEDVGYYSCACRDCFELYVGGPGEFCHDCAEAGCELDHDCQAPEAYGCEEIADERTAEDWKHHAE